MALPGRPQQGPRLRDTSAFQPPQGNLAGSTLRTGQVNTHSAYCRASRVDFISATALVASVSPLMAGVNALPAASNSGEATPAFLDLGSNTRLAVSGA